MWVGEKAFEQSIFFDRLSVLRQKHALGLLIFISLHVYDEEHPKIRWYMYVQGWLFLLIAASAYEWLWLAIDQGANIALDNIIVEDPYTWLAKRASIIFFVAVPYPPLPRRLQFNSKHSYH